jgi:hypothetical protein
MLRFFRWLLDRKPPETKPRRKKSTADLRVDLDAARNQIDRERKQKRQADDLGEQER